MTQPDPVVWGGWTLDGANLYIAPIGPADPRVALWTQYQENAPTVCAVFANEQAAQEVMLWINNALAGTAELNVALSRQLGLQ